MNEKLPARIDRPQPWSQPDVELQRQLCQFLREVGIDPSNVPLRSEVIVSSDRRKVTVDEFLRDENGRLATNGDRVATQQRTIVLAHPVDPQTVTDLALIPDGDG